MNFDKNIATREASTNGTNTHQDIGKMVLRSIRNLKDRKGSSLIDIKKYMASKYSLNTSAANNDIKRYLRGATKSGVISLTDGKYKVKTVARRRSRRAGAKKTKTKGRGRSRRRKKGKTAKSKGRSRSKKRASPKRKRSRRRRSKKRGSKKGK